VPFGLSAQEEEKKESFIYATYFYCNTATQELANELIKKNSVSVYDAAVADGTITSWGWSSHQVGGEYRRLGTMAKTAKRLWNSAIFAVPMLITCGMSCTKNPASGSISNTAGFHYENPLLSPSIRG
jgi:hypothetical protein